MNLTEIVFPEPEYNLACDEALLDLCEEGGCGEILRLWEPSQYFVVLGYSNKIDLEVNRLYCEKKGTPILRRCTGGGTVLQGPGCLNFSLILKTSNGRPVDSVTEANRYIMQTHQRALQELIGSEIKVQGHTDLTLGDLKFSGNAQRRRKKTLLFHGTFLIDFDISKMTKPLCMPSRQPEYRAQREHSDFLINLGISPSIIKDAIKKIWRADETFEKIPLEKVETLVQKRYGNLDWSQKW